MNLIAGLGTLYESAAPYPRPIGGVVLHDTETDGDVVPHPNGSWHYLVERDGMMRADVPEDMIAWHVARSDRWRPSWVQTSPMAVSDVNWSSIGIEIVSSARWRDQGVPFTDEQYASLNDLLTDIYNRHGVLPAVGHGEMQSDRTDPVGFDWPRAGFTMSDGVSGHTWNGSGPWMYSPPPTLPLPIWQSPSFLIPAVLVGAAGLALIASMD